MIKIKMLNIKKIYFGKIYVTYKITDKRIAGTTDFYGIDIPDISFVPYNLARKYSILYKTGCNEYKDLLTEEKYEVSKYDVSQKPFIMEGEIMPLECPLIDEKLKNRKWISKKKLLNLLKDSLIELNYVLFCQSDDKVKSKRYGGKK